MVSSKIHDGIEDTWYPKYFYNFIDRKKKKKRNSKNKRKKKFWLHWREEYGRKSRTL